MEEMDREDYIKKSEELLSQSTYKPIPTDPTTKYKNKLISLLKTIKAEGGINDTIYIRLYPTGAGTPQILWVTKGTQRRDATKTHHFQQRVSNI